ncbi:hypothetical protein [Nonomuraea sp. NPDC048916]|uniref:hypothetical protein n=1 Tax=Nonomuraea sp. NPDC048916 TaxID=3154232 RepID=UPI0033D1FB42
MGQARAEARMGFVNDGWLPITVTGVGVRADGFTLDSVTVDRGGRFPYSIPAGGRLDLTFGLDITDCDVAGSEIAPIVVEVDRWWGVTAVTAAVDEIGRPWQEFTIGSLCGSGI